MLSRLLIAITDHLSSTASHESTDVVASSGADLLKHPVSCLFTIASGGFSAFPFLLPLIFSRSSGFYPPRCYQASSALSPQYYPWICHPLHPPPLRVPLFGLSFMAFLAIAGGLPWVRRTTSPYLVQLHHGLVFPRISGLALSRRLDLLPIAI